MDIEVQNSRVQLMQKDRRNAKKLVSRWTKKKELTDNISQEVSKFKEEVAVPQNDNAVLKEKMEQFLDTNIKTIHNGIYNDNVRELYMDILSHNVSIRNCEQVIRTVLGKLTDSSIDRLPQKSLEARMMAEAEIIAKTCSRGQTALGKLYSPVRWNYKIIP